LLKQLQIPAFRDFLPLSIGIDKQVLAACLTWTAKPCALRWHPYGSLRYLKVMEKAKQRMTSTANRAPVTDNTAPTPPRC
jgi:ProP effector